MISYAQNPNLGMKTVTTILGDIEYRRNCRFIGDKYYLMDRDCFFVREKWTRADSGNIFYDYEVNIWVHKSEIDNLARGIVGFKNGEAIIGYYTHNPYTNVNCNSKKIPISVAINSQVLIDNGFFQDGATNIWYRASEMSASDIKTRKNIRNEINWTRQGYNIEDNATEYKNRTELYNNYPTSISKKAREMAKYLGDFTFGCEIEIALGGLSVNILNRHGIVVCRDGSIDGGPELVTIPLSGAKGLQNVVDICSELKGRSKLSIACAFHVHFGNVRKDKLFLAAFYVLCRKIQDELFTMFPFYKTDYRGVKKKNYNQKLDGLGIHPLIEKDKDSYETYLVDVYSRIFDFLAEGRITLDQLNKKTRAHPIKAKWERHSRYFWANVMNMFFTNRNTLEFRLHGPTTNSHKIVNWMFICVAIIRYAENNALAIITNKDASIPLKDVLDVFKQMHSKDAKATFLSEYLNGYFKSRQESFRKDVANGDVVSMWDIERDENYEFSYDGVKGLV